MTDELIVPTPPVPALPPVPKTKANRIVLIVLCTMLVVLAIVATWLWQQRKIDKLQRQLTALQAPKISPANQIVACGRSGSLTNYNLVIQSIDTTNRLITFHQMNGTSYDKDFQRLYCKEVLVVDSEGKTLSLSDLKPATIVNTTSDNNYVLKIEVLQ